MARRLFLTICVLALALDPLVGQTASLSPSTIEIISSGAEVAESSFTIFNTGVTEQTYFLDLLAFEPSGEDGSPLFTPEKTSQSEFLSWIDFPTREVLVPAISKVEVPFRVVIPDDIASGGYYGAITVSTAPTDVVVSNGATIEAKTAILVFLTIEGETVEKLELLDFAFEQTESALPFGTFSYRVQNQGNVHLTPEGEVRLMGLFGQTIASVDANEAQGKVLPSSTRTYEVVLDPGETSWLDRAGYQLKHLIIGPVTAQLQLSYGKDGSITSHTAMQVIPTELIIVLSGGLLVLCLLYKKLQKR